MMKMDESKMDIQVETMVAEKELCELTEPTLAGWRNTYTAKYWNSVIHHPWTTDEELFEDYWDDDYSAVYEIHEDLRDEYEKRRINDLAERLRDEYDERKGWKPNKRYENVSFEKAIADLMRNVIDWYDMAKTLMEIMEDYKKENEDDEEEEHMENLTMVKEHMENLTMVEVQ